MLNPFPIQFLAVLAYTFLRVGVAFIVMTLAIGHIRERKTLISFFSFRFFPFAPLTLLLTIIVEISLSALLFIGLHTQYVALLLMLYSVKFLVFKRYFPTPMFPSWHFYALMFFSSSLLFVTGAGAFAFDLPL